MIRHVMCPRCGLILNFDDKKFIDMHFIWLQITCMCQFKVMYPLQGFNLFLYNG